MIATVGLGTLAYITAWIMVDFKLKYMGVMNIGDAGELMFGKLGRRWFGWGLVLKVSLRLNSVSSEHRVSDVRRLWVLQGPTYLEVKRLSDPCHRTGSAVSGGVSSSPYSVLP